jgi:hypothetical protein
MKRLTFDELLNGPVQRCLLNEPIDYSVDFVVREETAEQRARRRWRMRRLMEDEMTEEERLMRAAARLAVRRPRKPSKYQIDENRRVREQEAERVLNALSPDASDEEIASTIANYYVCKRWHRNQIHLCILSDSPTSKGYLKFAAKHDPEFQAKYERGVEAHKRELVVIEGLGHDWHYKNVWGISTEDERRGRDWAVSAMLAGFAVFYKSSRRVSGFSIGSIADWRERQAGQRPDLDFQPNEGGR